MKRGNTVPELKTESNSPGDIMESMPQLHLHIESIFGKHSNTKNEPFL